MPPKRKPKVPVTVEEPPAKKGKGLKAGRPAGKPASCSPCRAKKVKCVHKGEPAAPRNKPVSEDPLFTEDSDYGDEVEGKPPVSAGPKVVTNDQIASQLNTVATLVESLSARIGALEQREESESVISGMVPMAPVTARGRVGGVDDIRADSLNRSRAAQYLQREGLFTTDDLDVAALIKQKSKRSGYLKTAADFVLHDEEWPQFHVTRIGQPPVTYDSLTVWFSGASSRSVCRPERAEGGTGIPQGHLHGGPLLRLEDGEGSQPCSIPSRGAGTRGKGGLRGHGRGPRPGHPPGHPRQALGRPCRCHSHSPSHPGCYPAGHGPMRQLPAGRLRHAG